MIQLENVAKRFATVSALDRIDLTIPAGAIFGLIGPDGAGKTTLIRLITGLLTPSQGQIRVLGLAKPEQIRPQIGYVPQKFSLYGDLTVMENIRFIGSMYNTSPKTIEQRAVEILTFTNLIRFQDRLADHLSGGMKQKLALAAGLMHRPKLFLLDEPTTGVDPVSRREFWQMLYNLNQEGMTIFVSTPYMDEAELCTEIAFIDQGRIIAQGSPQSLKAAYPYKLLELTTPDQKIGPRLKSCPGILDVNPFGMKYHLVVSNPRQAAFAVRSLLDQAGIAIIDLKEIPPNMEDIFVSLGQEAV